MKKIILIVISLLYINSYAQKKQLWAKSFINKKAPELVVEKWLSNVPTTKDKFILIDFWATWCGPCVRGIPEMNNFQKEF